VGENNPNDSRAETVLPSLIRSQVDTFRITNIKSELETLKQNQIKPKGHGYLAYLLVRVWGLNYNASVRRHHLSNHEQI
jgi:hypothetical protein